MDGFPPALLGCCFLSQLGSGEDVEQRRLLEVLAHEFFRCFSLVAHVKQAERQEGLSYRIIPTYLALGLGIPAPNDNDVFADRCRGDYLYVLAVRVLNTTWKC